jgi:hypothetical protein
MNSNRWRAVATGACTTLGVIALVLGLLLGYATRSVFNSKAFSARVANSLSEPGVSAFVAGKIADGVIAAQPDLTGVRPLIIAGSRSLLGTPAFRAAARRAALEAHRALMSGTGEKIILSVHDVGEILKTTLAMHPEVAAKLPRRLSARLAGMGDLPTGELAARLVRAAHRARLSFLALMIGGLALLGMGIALARDRRRVLFRTGATVTAVACVLWLGARFGGLVVGSLPHDPAMGLLAAGLWHAFVGGLARWALGLGLVGVVFASASASLLERDRTGERTRDLWRRLTTPPAGRGRQFLRGLAMLGLGVVAVVWPLVALTVLALLAGAVATFIGLRECFAAAMRALPEMERRLEKATAKEVRGGGRGATRSVLVGALALAVVAVVVVLLVRSPSESAAPTEITACNGYPELCDRRLDQVVFPTSHNSMSAADIPDWMFPNQNKSIPEQLEDGVRGFLIDAHYGIPVGDKVKTVIDDSTGSMAKYEAAVGKEGVAAAMRIRDRLVEGEGSERGVYMGHGFCELGATSLVETLGQMRDFLVANPGEILIIVIQDEGVTPQDIAKCFEESGLIDFVYRGPVTPPWPTLRQMAESDQRVVVMAENNSAGVPWYHQAFEVMQETPYTFHDTTQFSNKPNRGGTGGSLLLLNHWIESTPMPKPSNAAVVNAYDFLLRRARACQRQRHKLPNLIAVDFYATGDLMRVARTMNRIGQ